MEFVLWLSGVYVKQVTVQVRLVMIVQFFLFKIDPLRHSSSLLFVRLVEQSDDVG